MGKEIDFLIVGAMKAGTTTLMRYLVRNPYISIPDYEVHFFDDDNKYEKGLEWYRTNFDISDKTKIIGEKTPTYSYDPNVPARIHSKLPDSKIVWLFRNPVDRTYSNYIHAIMKGTERLSFKDAMKLEKERIEENIFKGYKKRSIYIEQVNRYRSYFPLKKMYFIIFEDFIHKPYEELEKLYDFLEVENKMLEKNNKKQIKSNQSYIPFSIDAQYYSYNLLGENSKLYKAINYLNKLLSTTPSPLDKEMRLCLRDYFSDYNKRLADLIGKDLSVWEE